MELILVRVKETGESMDLPIRRPKTIVGRKDTCDIRIPSADVSREHLAIEVSGDSARLTDLGSSNGTYVNQERVSGIVDLSPGDLLAVGSYVFVVQIGGEPAVIDPILSYEDGRPPARPERTPESRRPESAAAASPGPGGPRPPARDDEPDESSIIDFDFDFDDEEDDQPPL